MSRIKIGRRIEIGEVIWNWLGDEEAKGVEILSVTRYDPELPGVYEVLIVGDDESIIVTENLG